MDIADIASRLDLTNTNAVVRKAEELRRLSDLQFDSSIIGVGEVVKAIICVEIAASRLHVIFDRSAAIRMSGMSEKAYIRCFNAMHNGIGVKARLDVRELAVQFGCVRLISFVQKGLSLYKSRFLASLPASRRANVDFSRPVFTGVAFYLCTKKHKMKVDKLKLIELSGTSESEFLTIANSMNDLCFDVFGSSKEKKDPQDVKGHRELLDALPDKKMGIYDSDVSDNSSIDNSDDIEWDWGKGSPDRIKGRQREKLIGVGSERHRKVVVGDLQVRSECIFFAITWRSRCRLSCHKKHKKMEKKEYNEWKASIISSNSKGIAAPAKRLRQTQINFSRKEA